MGPSSPDFTVAYRTDQPPLETFEAYASRLADGLARVGISFEPKAGGRILHNGLELARITTWDVGREICIRWEAMPWGQSKDATIRALFAAEENGSRLSFSVEGWAALFDDTPTALPDWIAADLLPRILLRFVPQAVGDWLTDRRARRPGGSQARETYRDPTYHWPNFWLILDRIQLRSNDRLLEVGCGGGAFLRKALESGCSAAGVDHSPEMVALTEEVNAEAVRSGRLRVVQGDAARLPVGDGDYTCCVSTGAIGFFPDPLAALKEMNRALAHGGRLAVYAGTVALRGTPAAPEPVASRVRFFEGPELAELARQAGFSEVHVDEPDMEAYARRAGVPEEAMPLFRGSGGSLLLTARKLDPV